MYLMGELEKAFDHAMFSKIITNLLIIANFAICQQFLHDRYRVLVVR